MKFKYYIFCVLFFSVFCSSPYHPEYRGGRFSIYLLKDENIASQKAQKMDIDDLELADNPWITTEDIEYYDFSTHCIHLKKDAPPVQYNLTKPFVVVVGNKRIYLGHFLSLYSSWMPEGPYIQYEPSLYSKDVIHISESMPVFNKSEILDVRNDYRIKTALSRYGIYHESINVELKSVELISRSDTSTIAYTFRIKNTGDRDLYVPDPSRMGTELFHYYTNGINLALDRNHFYSSCYKTTEHPDPFWSWDYEWFTKIRKKSSLTCRIVLKGYPYIPDGNYSCDFIYTGPKNLNKNERRKTDGEIWVGKIKSNSINMEIKD